LIEQVMIFALGFLTAGLLALLFLPAFWRRAVRLSTRRLEMLMPLSINEVLAERDQMRAEAAIRERRLEQKIEGLTVLRAQDLAEIGRRMGIVAARERELAALQEKLDGVQSELAARMQELTATQAALVTSQEDIRQLTQSLASSDESGRVLQDVEKALRHEIDQYRTTIAGLETKFAGLEVAHQDLAARLKKAQLHIADQDAALRKAADERDFLKKEFESAAQRRDALMSEQAHHLQDLRVAQDEAQQARRARLRLEAELGSLSKMAAADAPTLNTQEQQVLRKAVSDIGTQILSLTQELAEARQREEPIDERIRSLRNRIKQVAG
jgi:chromosome segregation ATPase